MNFGHRLDDPVGCLKCVKSLRVHYLQLNSHALLDLSCLYKDQNFQNILIFRGCSMDICVLLYAIVLAILVNYMWLKKIHERVRLAP